MIAGLIGAAAIALWFLLVDTIQARPLYTPSVLGTFVFGGGVNPASVQDLAISFRMVILFTWVHGLTFAVIGVAAAWLLGLAERDPNYGFGIVLLFVFFEFGFIVVTILFAEGILHALTIPKILIGNLLAAGAMGFYFRRRHPDLTFHP